MATKRTTKSISRPSSQDWREATLSRMRALILEADPEMTQERKWKKAANPDGVPVFYHHGIVCTGETYRQVVKLTLPTEPACPIRRVYSMPAWRARRGGRSTSTKGRRLMRPPSRRW